MTLIPAARRRRQRLQLPPVANVRSWNRPALMVRLVQLVAGVALFLLPPHHHVIFDVLLVLGVLVAVLTPARNGQALVLIGAIGSWFYSGDVHIAQPVDRVLPFAFAIFVIHSATALAAMVPVDCELRPEVVRHWLARSGLSLAVSAVLIGVVYLIDDLTSDTTTSVLELLGVIGVLVIVAIGALLFSRLLNSDG